MRLFILAGMLIAFGAYCFVDAYIRGRFPYPENGDLNDFIGYYLNHVGGIVLPILGLVPLVWAIVFLRRVLVADDEGIGYVGKDRIPWAAVQSLDASKFASATAATGATRRSCWTAGNSTTSSRWWRWWRARSPPEGSKASPTPPGRSIRGMIRRGTAFSEVPSVGAPATRRATRGACGSALPTGPCSRTTPPPVWGSPPAQWAWWGSTPPVPGAAVPIR